MGEEHQSKGEGEEKMDSFKYPEIWSSGSEIKYQLGSGLTLFICKTTSQNQD